MALSSVEVEYMEESQAACEAIWMRKILVGLFGSHLDLTMIHCDNQSFIKLSINHVFYDRYKDIDSLVSSYQILCAVEDNVASVHSYIRSRHKHSDEGAHHEKIRIP
jgi:hypothetical protein